MEKQYVGNDLHSNKNVISIINNENKPVWSDKLKNSISEVQEKLKPYSESAVPGFHLFRLYAVLTQNPSEPGNFPIGCR